MILTDRDYAVNAQSSITQTLRSPHTAVESPFQSKTTEFYRPFVMAVEVI